MSLAATSTKVLSENVTSSLLGCRRPRSLAGNVLMPRDETASHVDHPEDDDRLLR